MARKPATPNVAKPHDKWQLGRGTFQCGNPDCPSKWKCGTPMFVDESHFTERGECKNRCAIGSEMVAEFVA